MALLQVWVHLVAAIHSLGLLASMKALIENVCVGVHPHGTGLTHTVEPL